MFDSDPYDEWMETIVSHHLFCRPLGRTQFVPWATAVIGHAWAKSFEWNRPDSDSCSQNKLGANMQCITSAEKIYVHRQAKGAQ